MTLAEAKKIYKTGKGHFFDKDTMKFWGSRIESELYPNRCFITSEDDFSGEERLFTVRQFSEDYKRIDTVGEFQEYESLIDAEVKALGVV